MQLTEEQVDEWADDANVMLSEENMGGTGVRASAEALLQSLVTCGSDSSGPAALAAALHQRLAEAEALRNQQPAVRVSHVCSPCCRHLLAICCVFRLSADPIAWVVLSGGDSLFCCLPAAYLPCSNLPWRGR